MFYSYSFSGELIINFQINNFETHKHVKTEWLIKYYAFVIKAFIKNIVGNEK